jgi:hypothetical protein
MRMLVLYGKGAMFAAPTLDASATKQDEMKWSKDDDVYLKKKTKYDEEKAERFGMILGQCDEPEQNKVEGHLKFAQMEQDCDVAAVLEAIKETAFDSHEKQYSACQAANAWKQLVYCNTHRTNNCPNLSAVHGDIGLDRAGLWDYRTISDGGC